MPFDKKYVAYETLTMIKNKHIVHHTFQFQQTGVMAFFRADTQRILIWAPDKTRIDKMSNKLFIFSGG